MKVDLVARLPVLYSGAETEMETGGRAPLYP